MIYKPNVSTFSFLENSKLNCAMTFKFYRRRARIKIWNRSSCKTVFDELITLPCPQTFKDQESYCRRFVFMILQKSIRPYVTLVQSVDLTPLILQEMKNFPQNEYKGEFRFESKGKLELKLSELPLQLTVITWSVGRLDTMYLNPPSKNFALLLIELMRKLNIKFNPGKRVSLSEYEESYFKKVITLVMRYSKTKQDMAILNFLEKVDTKYFIEFFKKL